MNSADIHRVKRIIANLDDAIDAFRRSSSKPVVGDIEAETSLISFTTELRKLVAASDAKARVADFAWNGALGQNQNGDHSARR